MTPTICHSGEGKTIEAVQRAVVARGQREEKRDEYVEHSGFLGH